MKQKPATVTWLQHESETEQPLKTVLSGSFAVLDAFDVGTRFHLKEKNEFSPSDPKLLTRMLCRSSELTGRLPIVFAPFPSDQAILWISFHGGPSQFDLEIVAGLAYC